MNKLGTKANRWQTTENYRKLLTSKTRNMYDPGILQPCLSARRRRTLATSVRALARCVGWRTYRQLGGLDCFALCHHFVPFRQNTLPYVMYYSCKHYKISKKTKTNIIPIFYFVLCINSIIHIL